MYLFSDIYFVIFIVAYGVIFKMYLNSFSNRMYNVCFPPFPVDPKPVPGRQKTHEVDC